jgi:WS/DGAT/MGAT family acyltransferase
MDRLHMLDAEFLHLEDGIAHMHIAGACVFADPPPTYDDVAALIASKLHLIPRYRQRVRTPPLELGRPVWVDDPHFDLGYHLRHTALPAPGDDETFRRLMGRLMSLPLDRERPLWETWLVEGLEGGRWALVFKVHHCMVDGIAGVALLGALLDVEPDAPLPTPPPWTPQPEPRGAVEVLDAWRGLVTDAVATGVGIVRSVVHPAGALRAALGAAQGLVRFLGDLAPTPPRSIEGSIGPHRAWAHSSASLDDVRTIRAAFGGTVNDVVLAAVSGGYRDLLLSRGDDVDAAVVRSLVPVSTRHEDGRGVPDNRVSAMLYDLPVGVADPVERLARVQAQMCELKGSHRVEAGEAVTELGDLAPPMVVGPLSRVAVRVLHHVTQRSVNTVTTNVPGPQFPLYCRGRELLEYRPYVPVYHGVRVSTGILSYHGNLYFGITGDEETAPDVAILAAGAARGIDELRERAREQSGDRRPDASRIPAGA